MHTFIYSVHVSSKIRWFLLLLLFGCCIVILAGCDILNSDSESTEPFLKELSSDIARNAWAKAIVEIPEGGYMVAGEGTDSEGSNNLFVTRLDRKGKILWEDFFRGDRKAGIEDAAYDLIRTNDNDYVLTGKVQNSLYLLKIDESGNTIWEHSYNRIDHAHSSDEGLGLTETEDGGFVIAGQTFVPYPDVELGEGWIVPSLLRVDEEGEEIWFNEYIDTFDRGHLLAVAEKSDGNYVAVGTPPGLLESFEAASGDGELVRHKAGDIAYQDIVCVEDDTCIAAGNANNTAEITVTKTRGDEVMWTKTLDAGSANSLTVTQDGGVVVAGSLYANDTLNPYLFKLDADGELEWELLDDGLISQRVLFGVTETREGDIVATGRKVHWKTGRITPLILRTTAQGDEIE